VIRILLKVDLDWKKEVNAGGASSEWFEGSPQGTEIVLETDRLKITMTRETLEQALRAFGGSK